MVTLKLLNYNKLGLHKL